MAFGYYPQPGTPGQYGGYYQTAPQQAAQMYPQTYPPAQAQQQAAMPAYWVQGVEAVKSQYVDPGKTAVFFDIEDPIFYFKTVDQSGMPKPLKICDYSERPNTAKRAATFAETPGVEYATKEELRALAEKIAELSERRGGRKATKGEEIDG